MGKLKILGDVVEGGLGMMRNALKAEDAVKELTAAERAAAGRKGAELIKSQPQVKASEALGQMREKGMKRTTTTQADRTRVGGGNIGGAPFSAISEADPNYAGKVWGVMDEGTAARLKNLTDPETAWTTMLGSANQLKTNPIVFDKLKRGFVDSMKQGNLSDELAGKINHNLELTFGAGADIRDPKIWRQADTFEKRAALADVMMGQGTAPGKGGVAIGGEKSGRGVIFQPTDILKRETEPSLLHTEHGGDVPTFAAGPRLFRLEKESEFRPDLHPGFPTLIKGKDLGVNMSPTPTEIYLPDWHAKFKKNNPERKGPGYYDLALGVKGEGLPSQELTDEYIRHLLREGFKDGGKVGDFDAKVDRLIEKHHFDNHVNKRIEEHFAKGGMPKLARTTLRMGKGGLLGKGAKALVDAMKAAEVVPAAEKVIVQQAPSIIIPSKVSNVKEAVRQSKGDYGARRVERAADEIPNLEKLYKEEALKQAFAGDNAKAMMTLNPSRFEEFATPIGSTFTRPNSVRRTSTGEQVTFPEYLEHLKSVGGFNDVPFLEINKQLQGTKATPFISGHEGRHRNRAMSESGEASGLVQLLPRSELREPFPRRSQEEYIEALKKELEMTGNIVLPQINKNQPHVPQRPAIDLPDIYATGGVILKHTTLRNRGATQPQPNGFKEGGKSEATVQATPRSKGYGAASDLLKNVHEFASKPFGYSNPPVEFISELLGIPAASRVLDKLSYGEPITNYGKANVPFMQDDTFDAAGALLGGLGSMSKLAKPLAKGLKMLPKNLPVGMSIKPVGDIPTGAPKLTVKPPSDNVANVRDANFQYPKTVGNQTVDINKLSGGVRMSDPKEVKRVKALADQMSGPEGYISRIIVDHNNNVIEGQHRLEALRQLGVKDVPVFKIEDLADTMPVSKMEEAMREAGGIHSDHVNQLMKHALDDISEGGIEGARKLDYGKFQKHYDAALDAVSGMRPVLPAAKREANLANMLEGSAVKNQLYHGTGRDIQKFDKSKLRRTAFGEGFHLAESPNLANFYANQFDEAQNVMPVYAAIKKPYELKSMHDWYDIPGANDTEKTNLLKSQGYDGVKYPHGAGGDSTSPSPNVYVAFEPEQIKSATGNRGTYDITDADISKARGGAILKHHTLRNRRANQRVR